MTRDIHTIPDDLPHPPDDHLADHLPGMRLPQIRLMSTSGVLLDISAQPGLLALFIYPRTGVPGKPPIVSDWDSIPGARGCTPQTCSFRDLFDEYTALKIAVFGMSVQSTEYQSEMAQRLHLPFPVLSDEKLAFTHALRLPTFTVAEQVLQKRCALAVRNGVILKAFYPVYPPEKNGREVLQYFHELLASG
ncbi:peroxiredoxin [Massilia sp. W12]|uniref:peroxiredoxin n=1 Tax=Massilia sp. W12 TaxID=3126507 RepID=UPI0030D134D1